MIRISVKSDKISSRKIVLFPSSESAELFRMELDRRVVKRSGQPESLFTSEEVLEIVGEILGWNEANTLAEPQAPVRIACGEPVVVTLYDEELIPKRRKTWTVSEPFLDFRGVWRVFVMNERKPVALKHVEVRA